MKYLFFLFSFFSLMYANFFSFYPTSKGFLDFQNENVIFYDYNESIPTDPNTYVIQYRNLYIPYTYDFMMFIPNHVKKVRILYKQVGSQGEIAFEMSFNPTFTQEVVNYRDHYETPLIDMLNNYTIELSPTNSAFLLDEDSLENYQFDKWLFFKYASNVMQREEDGALPVSGDVVTLDEVNQDADASDETTESVQLATLEGEWVYYFDKDFIDSQVAGMDIDEDDENYCSSITIAHNLCLYLYHTYKNRTKEAVGFSSDEFIVKDLDVVKDTNLEDNYDYQISNYFNYFEAKLKDLNLSDEQISELENAQFETLKTLIIPGKWNLLGVMFETDVSIIKEKLGIDKFWMFDPNTNQYKDSGDIKAGTGFWAKVSERSFDLKTDDENTSSDSDESGVDLPPPPPSDNSSFNYFEAKLKDLNLSDEQINLLKEAQFRTIKTMIVPNKWNLIGTMFDTTVTEVKSELGVNSVFPFDPNTNNYFTDGDIKAGSGMWVK